MGKRGQRGINDSEVPDSASERMGGRQVIKAEEALTEGGEKQVYLVKLPRVQRIQQVWKEQGW